MSYLEKSYDPVVTTVHRHCEHSLFQVNELLRSNSTRTSGDVGTLRHMINVVLNYCMNFPELYTVLESSCIGDVVLVAI